MRASLAGFLRHEWGMRPGDRVPRRRPAELDRKRGGNAGFGLGVRRRVGSNLPRIQLTVAYQEPLSRIRKLRLPDGAAIEYATGQVHGPAQFPITSEAA